MEDKEYEELIKERFKLLPKVVQQAIVSADVDKQLRALADTHKLHLDQWRSLQNQVMLTLLAIENSEDLQKNLQAEVGVPEEVANALAADISTIVFEPIRQELERQLEHPEAKAEAVSAVESARQQALAGESAAGAPAQPSSQAQTAPAQAPPPAPAIAPATPPQPKPEGAVVRAPISESYKAGEPSTARASVADDPYREPPA